jgi:hypothetical protein
MAHSGDLRRHDSSVGKQTTMIRFAVVLFWDGFVVNAQGRLAIKPIFLKYGQGVGPP